MRANTYAGYHLARMAGDRFEKLAWRLVAVLSVVAAGAAIGDEGAHVYPGALYFWDAASYVTALDAVNPYRSGAVFPFLYPPVAADLFKLGRSHVFELMAIAYTGAIAFFLSVYSRVDMPRKFVWLCAITAMGGMGVVSLKSGNVAITMNCVLLGLTIDAARGGGWPLRLLPIAIGCGALIKPQFILYLGLLPVLERTWRAALIASAVTVAAVVLVHAGYLVWRADQWNDYVTAVRARVLTEKDFGWGSAEFFMHLTGSTTAALAGYGAMLLAVCALAGMAWRQSPAAGRLSMACLAFVVLTFANPRAPLYDLYAAGIALVVCCGLTGRREHVAVLVAGLALNLVPWLIAEFARTPAAWPWWAGDYMITHLAGVSVLLLSLARTGLAPPLTRS
jgi:hypothetical protein